MSVIVTCVVCGQQKKRYGAAACSARFCSHRCRVDYARQGIDGGLLQEKVVALETEIAKHLAQIKYLEDCGTALFNEVVVLRPHMPAAEQWEALVEIMRTKYGLIEAVEFLYEALDCRRYVLEYGVDAAKGKRQLASVRKWATAYPYDGPAAAMMADISGDGL